MLTPDQDLYTSTVYSALHQQVALLEKYWPNGIRNVLAGRFRLFFKEDKRLCAGAPGLTNSDESIFDFAAKLSGDLQGELLGAVSSYVWKRMTNKGSGVQMPSVELPSQRKYMHNLPGQIASPAGFSDPRAGVSGPPTAIPGPKQANIPRIGPPSAQLPPGKKR